MIAGHFSALIPLHFLFPVCLIRVESINKQFAVHCLWRHVTTQRDVRKILESRTIVARNKAGWARSAQRIELPRVL